MDEPLSERCLSGRGFVFFAWVSRIKLPKTLFTGGFFGRLYIPFVLGGKRTVCSAILFTALTLWGGWVGPAMGDIEGRLERLGKKVQKRRLKRSEKQ